MAGLQKEEKYRSMPKSIALVMKEAKRMDNLKSLKTKDKKSKKCKGSLSQPCCSEILLAEQRAYPGEGGSRAVRLLRL